MALRTEPPSRRKPSSLAAGLEETAEGVIGLGYLE
jgi:hypothetical protein